MRAEGTDVGRLRRSIAALVRRFSISERADVACCGTTVAQAAALRALRVEGPLRAGELGQLLGISPSTTTRNVARLEERGLVERAADPGDRRVARLRLTRRGLEAAQNVERYEHAFATAVLARLPAERRADVLDDLERLTHAIREATESCCPGAFDHLVTETEAERCGKGGG